MPGFFSTCEWCGTGRVKWVSMSGVTKPRYTYPKGYQQTGEDKLTMQELRREYVVMMMTVMS